MQSFFIWKGIDCRSKGIRLASAAPIIRGEEAVTHVTIPGRAGELTLTEGEKVFRSYIQSVTIIVPRSYNVRDVYNWLSGDGELTLSAEPDRKQHARVIGAITLERVSKCLDFYQGSVQFYCDPVKQSMHEADETVTINGTLKNNGDMPCKPLVVLNGINAENPVVLSVGGKSISIDLSGMENPVTTVRVDCDAQMVTSVDGETNLTAFSTGEFPEVPVGECQIAGSNWTNAVVSMRRRFL